MPVRFLGSVAYRRLPAARLADVQSDAALSVERDLRQAPAPISGGMRKALAKARTAQDALRFRSSRSLGAIDLRRAYGLIQATCGHCRHMMYFDEIEPGAAVRCDRCRRPVG